MRKKQCQMYVISMAWHSPLAREANTMKDALVSPEVVMNIHMHMYTEMSFHHQSQCGFKLTSFSFDNRCECKLMQQTTDWHHEFYC